MSKLRQSTGPGPGADCGVAGVPTLGPLHWLGGDHAHAAGPPLHRPLVPPQLYHHHLHYLQQQSDICRIFNIFSVLTTQCHVSLLQATALTRLCLTAHPMYLISICDTGNICELWHVWTLAYVINRYQSPSMLCKKKRLPKVGRHKKHPISVFSVFRSWIFRQNILNVLIKCCWYAFLLIASQLQCAIEELLVAVTECSPAQSPQHHSRHVIVSTNKMLCPAPRHQHTTNNSYFRNVATDLTREKG